MLLKNKRILIVEDNLVNKAVQSLLLEHQGATIFIDRWGKQTLKTLKESMPIDIILLDLMLPNKVSGYDIYEVIRQHDEYNHIPIVAISASNASEAIVRTKECGFNGFIAKPVDFDRFAHQIAEIIDGKELWIEH